MDREYVLGTGSDELERLAFQHRLWSDAAHAAWRKARIRVGHRVLDVGSGPGFASFDLAQLVTREGSVTGVDESAGFIAHLNDQAAARRLPQLRGVVGDVQQLAGIAGIEPGFDFAWARWVLCFVPHPERVIEDIARLLRPGGAVVIHDYFHYESMTAAPKHPSHERATAATMRSWRARGGNTDVGGDLPRLFRENGLILEHLEAHARAARSGDTMFHWPEIWWRTYAPKLVAMGELTQAECDELLELYRQMALDPDCFVQCPVVYEFIARKPAAS